MFQRWKTPVAVDSPVLVVDALGFGAKIKACDPDGLVDLSELLDRQYHQFRAKIPFGIVLVTHKRVWGSREFSIFRLNDMFVLFSEHATQEAPHRHAVAALLLYQALLLEGFIPRGGLGAGLVLRKKDSILGGGFMDAYEAAEKRPTTTKDVCAVRLSDAFFARIPRSKMTYRLFCFYENSFFLNPRALTDPEMGEFDNERIMALLRSAGANGAKLDATARFLNEFEDYDAALSPGSRSWEFLRSLADDHE